VFKAWFCYSKFCPIGMQTATVATFTDLGGHRWACDECVKDSMRTSGLWTTQMQPVHASTSPQDDARTAVR
jgi:hypothetical protein